MFVPNEITQTTEALEGLTGVLERPRASTGKRPRIAEDKNTDILPSLALESPNAKVAWRQVAQLRKENRHLRTVLEGQRAKTQKILSEYTQLRSTLDHQPVEAHQDSQLQTQLQALMDERNQLSERLQAQEERYEALEQSVQAEAHKLMQEAAETAIHSPDQASPLIQDVVKTVESQVREKEDKHLREVLYLKREVLRMADLLAQERQQLQQEQQQLLSFQLSIREQATARQKLLEERIRTHHKIVSIVMSFALLALFVVLEFVCLALFHTPVAGSVTLSILIPVLVCILLRMIVLTPPFHFIKLMYKSAPHKRRAPAQA